MEVFLEFLMLKYLISTPDVPDALWGANGNTRMYPSEMVIHIGLKSTPSLGTNITNFGGLENKKLSRRLYTVAVWAC